MLRTLTLSAIALAFISAVSPAQALEQTVVLSIENATCELCAPIVRMSLERVAGVVSVIVAEDYSLSPPVTATVVFDDAATNIDALIAATTNAGYLSYPASPAD